MLQIPYTAHRSNMSIVEQLKIKTSLSTSINQTYLRYFGHTSRKPSGLEKLNVDEKVNGKRTPNEDNHRVCCQHRSTWTDTIEAIAS